MAAVIIYLAFFYEEEPTILDSGVNTQEQIDNDTTEIVNDEEKLKFEGKDGYYIYPEREDFVYRFRGKTWMRQKVATFPNESLWQAVEEKSIPDLEKMAFWDPERNVTNKKTEVTKTGPRSENHIEDEPQQQTNEDPCFGYEGAKSNAKSTIQKGDLITLKQMIGSMAPYAKSNCGDAKQVLGEMRAKINELEKTNK
jgi:hypothetical protein